MVLLRRKLDLTTKRVGKLFRRSHTTILSGEIAIRDLCETDQKFARQFSAIAFDIDQQLKPIAEVSHPAGRKSETDQMQ